MERQTFWKWSQLINSSHICTCYFTDTVEKKSIWSVTNNEDLWSGEGEHLKTEEKQKWNKNQLLAKFNLNYSEDGC